MKRYLPLMFLSAGFALVATGLIWFLTDALAAAHNLPRGGGSRGPMRLLLLAGGILGWSGVSVSEHVTGNVGLPTALLAVLTSAASLAVAYLLCVFVIGSPEAAVSDAIATAAVAMCATTIIRAVMGYV